jgi:FKBP-type peptidyl-prolyl cis-trans isomerase
MKFIRVKNHVFACISMIGILSFIFVGCRQAPQLPSNQLTPDDENIQLLTLNKAIVNVECNQIIQYIHQHRLSMQKDSLGYWISILQKGEGALPKNNEVITYQYSISLLNGTCCYSNYNTSNTSTLLIGRAHTIRGIEMGLMKLQQGGEALIILPSILGYSVSGDGHCIPPYSPLIVNLRLIHIKM